MFVFLTFPRTATVLCQTQSYELERVRIVARRQTRSPLPRSLCVSWGNASLCKYVQRDTAAHRSQG